jgi:hypothetical protein
MLFAQQLAADFSSPVMPEMFMAFSDSQGRYELNLSPGERTIFCSKEGYERASRHVTVASGGTETNFSLSPAAVVPSGTISGTLTDKTTGAPIAEALVQLEPLDSTLPTPDFMSGGYLPFFAMTDLNGGYTLSNVPAGTYRVNAFKWGAYEDASRTVSVTTGSMHAVADFQMLPYSLPPIPSFTPLPTFTPFPEPSFSPFPTFTPPPVPSIGPEPTPGPSGSPLPTPLPFVNVTLLVSTDKFAYAVGETVQINLSLQNNSTSSVTLHFPTAQIYDLVLTPLSFGGGGFDFPDDINFEIVSLKSKADEIWRWSNGQAFAQVQTDLTLEAGEIRSYAVTWDQKSDGHQVTSGTYNLNGTITADPRIEAIFPGIITIGSYLPF